MGLEEQIAAYKELGKKIDELEEQRKALSISIMQEMQGKSMKVANYLVRKYSRLAIKLSVEEARSLGAVKMEELVDKEKIKELYSKGQVIQGVSEIQYIQISSVKEK